MSRDLANENYYVSHGGRIPVKWTAPEVYSVEDNTIIVHLVRKAVTFFSACTYPKVKMWREV